MNIYRFLDSRDIREHLQKLNYSFTVQEAAFLVYRCKTASLKEKIAAWQEIIDTMPNCAVAERINLKPVPDFHQFLRDYIDLQNREVQRFKNADGCVYIFEISLYDDSRADYQIGPYSSFDRCLTAGLRETEGEKIKSIHITKRPLNYDEEWLRYDYCFLTPQGKICRLDCTPLNSCDTELSLSFDGMWFDFPTPFHAGDIVYSCTDRDDPFVLTGICTWNAETLRRELPVSEYSDTRLNGLDHTLARIHACGDASDMTCRGYSVVSDPRNSTPFVINDHSLCNYMDLEYCREPLRGAHKALKPISEFLKGSCNIEFLLNTYSLTWQQTASEQASNLARLWYGEKNLSKIGIK